MEIHIVQIFIYALTAFVWPVLEQLIIIPKRAVLTKAKVIGYREHHASNTVVFEPQVQYTVLGEQIKSSLRLSRPIKKYELGQVINIYYDPSDFQHTYVKSNTSIALKVAYVIACLVLISLTSIKYGFSLAGFAIFITLSFWLIKGIKNRHNKFRQRTGKPVT